VSWVVEALGPTLARVARDQAAAKEHRASCSQTPCETCERYLCRKCQGPAGGSRLCDACHRTNRLARLTDQVPRRFHWAMGATVTELAKRVKGSSELLTRAITAPPLADVVLLGDTGAGKTSLVVAMLHAWCAADLERLDEVRFVTGWQLSAARGRQPLGQGEAPDVLEAMHAPLLVLDDLGSERDDRHNGISDTIMFRHAEGLPTWVTTGFDAAECVSRYGSGVTRRLFEGSRLVRLGAK